jgi:hypothetical protein
VPDRKLLSVRSTFGGKRDTWTEGFHVRTETGETSYGDLLVMQAVVYTWFYQVPLAGFFSRASLMPHVYSLQSMVVLTIVGDVIPVFGDALDAIDVAFAEAETEPLPLNSSVMIKLESNFGGKGRYGRIHTAGLSSADLYPDQSYRMPPDRVNLYELVYQLLYEMVNAAVGPNSPYRMVNRHAGRIHPSTDPMGKYDLTTGVRICSSNIGTMQLRSPGHGHGRHLSTDPPRV